MIYYTFLAATLLIAGHSKAHMLDSEPNLAPFTSMEVNAVVNNTKVIHLHCGRALAEHANNLAFNLSAQKGFFEMRWLPGYRALLDDEMLLEVRSQPVRSLRVIGRNVASCLWSIHRTLG